MTVRIYRDAGKAARPTFYGVVTNPQAKQPSGALITAGTYQELRSMAEARAERKADLLRQRQARSLSQ
ncbi:hypothetical protein [Variovorax soli]|uniref:Integrase DNA-binding domain-containing protein n=1 Tax=Variovorax soli TaxID=376815 RepID=A0ABU1NG49_9BURK|nr:hypothetical protein [Variovorax soli]MDR6536985.1 hypothetical protein [Variovorax soli]